MEGSNSNLRAAAAACALLSCTAAYPAGAADRVVLLNWPDYFDPAVAEEFRAETGIDIEQVDYADDSDRDAMIALAEPGEFDVVVVSSDRVELLSDSGWLAPLGEHEAPNTANIDPEWWNSVPEARGFAVPMAWGTVGIAYRRDLVEEPITSWNQVFAPDAGLCGHFWMLSDSRENIKLALLYLGYIAEETTAAHLAGARDLLLSQMDCVAEYRYPDLTGEAKLVTGEIAAAVMYGNDAAILSRLEPRIEFVVPDDLTIRWTDYLIVPEASQRKPSAYRLIDFLNRPDIAAQLADYLSFASPIAAARARQSADVVEHPAIAPGRGVRMFEDRSPHRNIIRFMNTLIAELELRQKAL